MKQETKKDILCVIGAVLVLAGVAKISIAASLIVGGVVLVLLAFAPTKRGSE
jgi:hypothetical protein